MPKSIITIGARTKFFKEEIIFLEADVNYTKVHLRNGEKKLISYTLKKVLDSLNEEGDYLRISHKHAVNQDFVDQIGQLNITLKNGTTLATSRRKRKLFSCY